MIDEIKPYYFDLFQHMSDNHGLTLLDSELEDIVQVARKYDSSPDAIAVPRELVLASISSMKGILGFLTHDVNRRRVSAEIEQLEALLK